ncbi:MAG: aspartate-semialdehyde dehydrogenase, partial [Flavobacteriaceae bacterium]
MKLAVVGVTGIVGQEILKVLKESDIEIDEFIPVASERSIGKELIFDNKKYIITGIQNAIDKKLDVAIFSAGGNTSLEWAEKFSEVGTTVIDNSSAWRMDETKKLIIPEINGHLLTKSDKIIA